MSRVQYFEFSSLVFKWLLARRLTKAEPERIPENKIGNVRKQIGNELKERKGTHTIRTSDFFNQQRRNVLYNIRGDIEGSTSGINHDKAVLWILEDRRTFTSGFKTFQEKKRTERTSSARPFITHA